MKRFISKIGIILLIVLAAFVLRGCTKNDHPVISPASAEHLIPLVTEWESEEALAEGDIPAEKPALSIGNETDR